MALSSLVNTEALCEDSSKSKIILDYLDSLYANQILPAAIKDGIPKKETNSTWDDWRQRLQHPHFGLSTFFITQNGASKCGIRLGPTIKGLVNAGQPLCVSMAFAVAAILRFLTPVNGSNASEGWSERVSIAKERGIYVGWLDGVDYKEDTIEQKSSGEDTVAYADGLKYNLKEGWHEFRCDCLIKNGDREFNLPDLLSRLGNSKQPFAYIQAIRSYLLHSKGGNLQSLLLECDDEENELSRARELDMFVNC